MEPALRRIKITDEEEPRLVVQFKCFADFIGLYKDDTNINLPKIYVDESYFKKGGSSTCTCED